MESEPLVLAPSDFVALLNQTLEYAYPNVVIEGELSSFRISKNRWLYFDLKDEQATVKFFGTVYQLPGPLEDGMVVRVRAVPRLHPQFGFSLTVQSIQPVGEGSLKRAFALLQAKLTAEGMFEPARKRSLPYPPLRVGLIASAESAAYADFVKITAERWGGVEIIHADVHVQGESAPLQLVAAIEHFNAQAELVDVLVITRGGGSMEDLAAFSTEQVTRAVAASRIPTLVAIGHEVDISLAELAADQRASTPSNAAQLLVPDKREALERLGATRQLLSDRLSLILAAQTDKLKDDKGRLLASLEMLHVQAADRLSQKKQLLAAYDPRAILRRGYALVHDANSGRIIASAKTAQAAGRVRIDLADGSVNAQVEATTRKSKD